MLNIGPMELTFILITTVIVLLGSIVWIWALIDCLQNEPPGSSEKIIWILIILFAHFIGAVLYFTIRKPSRKTS
jgi:hypothetical protein